MCEARVIFNVCPMDHTTLARFWIIQSVKVTGSVDCTEAMIDHPTNQGNTFIILALRIHCFLKQECKAERHPYMTYARLAPALSWALNGVHL